MPDVTINGKTVVIERFTLAKATRVITLLKLIQKQMPDITDEWATFRREYAEKYSVNLDRLNAIARFGDSLEHIPDSEWERAGNMLPVPALPSTAETFFHMAPMVYEGAEEVVLRLLGLLAMSNDTVNRYARSGDIWERVDEFVDETIRPAELDEILELITVAAEVIDGQVFQKVQQMGERAGNVARLFGIRSTKQTQQAQGTSSEQPEQPSSPTSERSQSDTDGTPRPSEISIGTTAAGSSTQTPSTATVS